MIVAVPRVRVPASRILGVHLSGFLFFFIFLAASSAVSDERARAIRDRLWTVAGAPGPAPAIQIRESGSHLASMGDRVIYLSYQATLLTDDALAFLIGHELGHVVLAHSVSSMNRAEQELDADIMGLRLAVAAGFDRSKILAGLSGLAAKKDAGAVYCPFEARRVLLERVPLPDQMAPPTDSLPVAPISEAPPATPPHAQSTTAVGKDLKESAEPATPTSKTISRPPAKDVTTSPYLVGAVPPGNVVSSPWQAEIQMAAPPPVVTGPETWQPSPQVVSPKPESGSQGNGCSSRETECAEKQCAPKFYSRWGPSTYRSCLALWCRGITPVCVTSIVQAK